MFPYKIIIAVFIMMNLAACSLEAGQDDATVISTETPIVTSTSIVTEAPTATQTATLTATATHPPAQIPTAVPLAGCLDSEFIRDVTIPDGTFIPEGQPFTKIWRLNNSGTCSWNNVRLVMIENETNIFGWDGDEQFVELPFVAPGEIIDVSATLRILGNLQLGTTVRARFQLMDAKGTLFGTQPYVEVGVDYGQ